MSFKDVTEFDRPNYFNLLLGELFMVVYLESSWDVGNDWESYYLSSIVLLLSNGYSMATLLYLFLKS